LEVSILQVINREKDDFLITGEDILFSDTMQSHNMLWKKYANKNAAKLYVLLRLL